MKLPVLPPTPLADLVREAASAAPESVAVEAAGRAVTYWDLVGSADRLAEELREAGAGTVAVTGPCGIGFVVALLAAATAPVRLVTVDPELPASRRVAMLKAAAVDLILATDEASAAEVASLNLVPAKEKESTGAAGGTGRVPVCPLSPDGLSLARPLPAVGPATGSATYVFFTAGTTGEAKAVLGRQAAAAHFVRWQRVRFLAGPGDRFAQLAGPSSDVFLRDVFTPLGAGATLCIPPADVTARPGGVVAWLTEAGITAVHAVPSLATRWIAAAGPAEGTSVLRLSFFAGEPLSDTTVSRWRERFPGTRVINLYGPTETTLAKFCHEVGEPVPGIQPVGRPLPETDLRLVDGEVWIRTPHRTDGYLDDPRETNSRFVREGGEVWYRTGDLGWLDDLGQLRLRGRTDFQVTIEGDRIEPEGVTAVLRGHPGVRDAVVTARTYPDGTPYLAAYYVPEAAGSGDLRDWLAGRLPAAQVPTVFRRMDELPLGPHGKIDRSALPDPLEPGEGGRSGVSVFDEARRVIPAPRMPHPVP